MRGICKVSVPLIGDFVFNNVKIVSTGNSVCVSVPLIGDFVFNQYEAQRYVWGVLTVSVPLIGDFVFNSIME